MRDPIANNETSCKEEQVDCRESVSPQSSADVFKTDLEGFVLRQLESPQRVMAKDHAAALREILLGGDTEAIRDWAARRIAVEDAVGQILAAIRQNLLAENELSKPLVNAVKDFDHLATTSHRRLMDWIEVLRRHNSERSPAVTIKEAGQVAIVTGKGTS